VRGLMSKIRGKLPPVTVRLDGPDSAIGARVEILDQRARWSAPA